MFSLPKTLRIGVIRGGVSPEYNVSLKTGETVLKHLSETHRPSDIFISKDGMWHMNGIQRTPDRVLKHVDVVYNALHGVYGEDGTVQGLLHQYGIPYTGSDKIASALAMNKCMTKDKAVSLGIKTPLYTVVSPDDNMAQKLREVTTLIPYPLVIKPSHGGSSLGITIARTREEMIAGIEHALLCGGSVIVEEYIAGKQATCGIIDNFRNQDTYALPVVEVVLSESDSFLDYDSKYSGKSNIISPGNFTMEEKREIEEVSKALHKTLGLRHYSRSDFIVSPRRGVYFLEVNSLPGLTQACPFPKSIESVGIKIGDFIDHTLLQALNKR